LQMDTSSFNFFKLFLELIGMLKSIHYRLILVNT
jgi:hypothetical protein